MAAQAALRRGASPLGGVSLSESSAGGSSWRSAPLNSWLRAQQRLHGGREVHGQGIADLPRGPALLTGERGVRDALHPLRQSLGVSMASEAAPAQVLPPTEADLAAQVGVHTRRACNPRFLSEACTKAAAIDWGS